MSYTVRRYELHGGCCDGACYGWPQMWYDVDVEIEGICPHHTRYIGRVPDSLDDDDRELAHLRLGADVPSGNPVITVKLDKDAVLQPA